MQKRNRWASLLRQGAQFPGLSPVHLFGLVYTALALVALLQEAASPLGLQKEIWSYNKSWHGLPSQSSLRLCCKPHAGLWQEPHRDQHRGWTHPPNQDKILENTVRSYKPCRLTGVSRQCDGALMPFFIVVEDWLCLTVPTMPLEIKSSLLFGLVNRTTCHPSNSVGPALVFVQATHLIKRNVTHF